MLEAIKAALKASSTYAVLAVLGVFLFLFKEPVLAAVQLEDSGNLTMILFFLLLAVVVIAGAAVYHNRSSNRNVVRQSERVNIHYGTGDTDNQVEDSKDVTIGQPSDKKKA